MIFVIAAGTGIGILMANTERRTSLIGAGLLAFGTIGLILIT